MSEFSESYHLKNGSLQDAIDLIKKSSQSGYAKKPCKDWVTLVPESAICGFNCDKKLVKNNTGILVQYIYPEDHGFCFRVFNRNRLVAEYFYDFNDFDESNIGAALVTNRLNGKELVELLNLKVSEFELVRTLRPTNFSEVMDLHDNFMKLLQIPPEAYTWVSHRYCKLDKEQCVKSEFIAVT
ncbi:MAG: hypothetical protein LBS74_11400 [Oscillospiraceae bacterium]|jgi:hypothetical protein|nr:hypothetical protein [Oscillospiraceae bacterium]